MSKNTKTVLVIILIALLALAIIWAVYESYKPEPASINTTTNLPDENKGLDNIINDFVVNEVNNNVEDENIVEENKNNINQQEQEEDNNEKENTQSSEVVPGTSESREEKAIELAKEFYEEEYGNIDELAFRYDSVYKDGRHIVVVSSTGGKTVAFLFVDLNTGLVQKK